MGRPRDRGSTGGWARQVILDHRSRAVARWWSWDLCWGAQRLVGMELQRRVCREE